MSERAAQLVDEIAELNKRIRWVDAIIAELKAGNVSEERLAEIEGIDKN